jgi:hypothetical protein
MVRSFFQWRWWTTALGVALGLACIVDGHPAEPIVGEIAYPGEEDPYSFTLAAPATLVFDAQTPNSALRWSLTGPPGTVVDGRAFTASDGDANNDPLLRLPAGDYVLTIRADGSATGPYQFALLDLADAALITPGTTIGNTNLPKRATDLYQFSAAAGDAVTFDAQGVSGGGALYWRLVDPYGRILWQNFFTDVNNFTLAASGQYRLLVESLLSGTSATNYTFRLVPLGNTPPPAFTGTPLTLGVGVTNVLATPGATNAYTFTLAQPTWLYFDSLTNNSRLRYTLFGPPGVVASTRGFSGGVRGDLHEAPAGDYQLVVSAVSGYAGSFAFRLIDLAGATPITPGTVVNGTNAPAAGLTPYRFSAKAGDRFYFDALARAGYTYVGNAFWTLIDPFGNSLFADAGFGDVGTLTLTATGIYTLWVAGGDAEPRMEATHSFNVVPVLESSAALALDTTYSGAIATPGQRYRYLFTLTQPKRVYFQSLTARSDLRWSLRGAAGEVASNLPVSQGLWPAYNLIPGDYELTVFANGDATGEFGFRLVDFASAVPIGAETPVNGVAAPAKTIQLYSFSVTAGQRFYFDRLSASGFTYYGIPFWRLEDAEGNRFVNPETGAAFDGGFADVGPVTFNRTGTYTLLVGGNINEPGATGNYSFRIVPVSDATATLALNTPVEATIATPGQRLTYTFTLTAPTRVTFDNLQNVPGLNWSLATPGRTYAANVSFSSDAWHVYDLVAGD